MLVTIFCLIAILALIALCIDFIDFIVTILSVMKDLAVTKFFQNFVDFSFIAYCDQAAEIEKTSKSLKKQPKISNFCHIKVFLNSAA